MLWNPQRVTIQVIDSAEDGDVSEYSGTTTEFDTVDPTGLGTSWPAPDGSLVIRNGGGQGFSRIFSTPGDGLANYFPKGSRARCYTRATGQNGDLRVLFGLSANDTYYAVQVGYESSNVRLFILDGGSETELAADSGVSPTQDTTGYVDITWDDGTLGGSDNDLTAEYVEGGSTLTTLTANDSTLATNEGIGFVGSGNDSANHFWDYYHLR